MLVKIRDGYGRMRTDIDSIALIDAIRRCDPGLVAGSLNEMVLSREEPASAELIYHRSDDGRYMVTHVDADQRAFTAVADDGDPTQTVTIAVAGEPEQWPDDHFIDPITAGALAERFLLDGGQDGSADWRPSTAHL